MTRFPLWSFVFLIFTCAIPAALAHPSDISYLRVKVERQRLEMRFTVNLLTLTRFATIDSDQDHRIEKTELDAAAPALIDYFQQHIQIHLNEKKATLGNASALESVWPVTDGSDSVAEVDYPVRHVDIIFTQEVKPVLADVWLEFDIWQQTGPLSTLEATFEQGDLRMQVPFSQGEPDYLYDTGFAVEELFREPAKIVEPPVSKGWRLLWLLPIMGLVALIWSRVQK